MITKTNEKNLSVELRQDLEALIAEQRVRFGGEKSNSRPISSAFQPVVKKKSFQKICLGSSRSQLDFMFSGVFSSSKEKIFELDSMRKLNEKLSEARS
jgi:hypothetical protein